ncbi:MAG: hypothetical protein HQL25_04450 [Candidatus Omnitrophica bacterium]|nr:hypothetical protein [Candidatus Omnitrophota bacterium]
MFGLNDPQIWLAYVLCIAGTLLCVIYGAVNWNKGDEPVYPEDEKWVKDEKNIEEEL